jgi:hypothetical protein
MSIRLLQAIFLAGVFTDVDGATLTLSAAQESDLVAQGKAVYVASPLQVTRQTVLRDDLASLGVRGVDKRSRAPAVLFGGSTMSLSQVTIVSGSPTLSIEVDAKGRKRLKVVTGSGVAAQLSFSPLVNGFCFLNPKRGIVIAQDRQNALCTRDINFLRLNRRMKLRNIQAPTRN